MVDPSFYLVFGIVLSGSTEDSTGTAVGSK